MSTQLTAIIKKDGDWWLGWLEGVPGANAQERTKEDCDVEEGEADMRILPLDHNSNHAGSRRA